MPEVYAQDSRLHLYNGLLTDFIKIEYNQLILINIKKDIAKGSIKINTYCIPHIGINSSNIECLECRFVEERKRHQIKVPFSTATKKYILIKHLIILIFFSMSFF